MAKKITLLMIVMLLVSALVFVSCSGDVKKQSAEEGKNLVAGGDFEGLDAYDDIEELDDDGATPALAPGEGVDGSTALSVELTDSWGGMVLYLEDYYAPGKSYYVECSFKNKGTAEPVLAHIEYTVVSGLDMANAAAAGVEYYDLEETKMYDGSFSDDPFEEYGIKATSTAMPINGDSYVTLSGVIPAEEIADIVGDSGLALFFVTLYVGEQKETDVGNSFYIDNIVVRDLNEDIKVTGPTWTEPAT